MPSLAVLRLLPVFALASIGAFMPFVGARMEALGFSAVELGLLTALLPIGRLISSPIWAAVADRWQVAGLLLRVGSAMAVVAGGLILWGTTPSTVAAGMLLFAVGRTPTGPLVDSLTVQALRAAGRESGEYGRIRLWGSVGFLGAALLGAQAGPWFAEAILVGTLLVTFLVPSRGEGGPAPILPALRALASRPFLPPLLLTVALHALTLSVYDLFLSTHVRARGFDETVTAAAIGVGVSAEIATMWIAPALLRRFGAGWLLVVATVVCVPRWWLVAHVVSAPALVALQILHGPGFAAFWLAGVEIMSKRAPREIAASAQALFGAASYGVGALAGAILAGTMKHLADTDALFVVLCGVSLGATASAIWLTRRMLRP